MNVFAALVNVSRWTQTKTDIFVVTRVKYIIRREQRSARHRTSTFLSYTYEKNKNPHFSRILKQNTDIRSTTRVNFFFLLRMYYFLCCWKFFISHSIDRHTTNARLVKSTHFNARRHQPPRRFRLFCTVRVPIPI